MITEINARFAGGFALREAVGADLVQQTLNGLFDLPVDYDRLAAKPDVYLSKYVTVPAHGPAPCHPEAPRERPDRTEPTQPPIRV